jgi:hydrogenase expression/formation protein HypC
MCLGIPGKVVEIRDDGALRMARVDFGGVRKEACLAYLPEVGIGDYVIVHVGFAISQLDEDEALKTLELLRMIDDEAVAMELGSMPSEAPAERGTAGSPASAGSPAPPAAPGAPA